MPVYAGEDGSPQLYTPSSASYDTTTFPPINVNPPQAQSQPNRQHDPEKQPHEVSPVPLVGGRAPQSEQIRFPSAKPTVVLFLRHCGCPFAEKAFRLLTALSVSHPNLHFLAVSHSSPSDTDAWVIDVGGEWEADVIVDESRALYAKWGLGTTSTWYAYKPWALWNTYKLGVAEGIWGRKEKPRAASVGSGSVWQMGGAFAVDRMGFVRWVGVPADASEVPDLKRAVEVLEEQYGGPGQGTGSVKVKKNGKA
ncbi:hypothetical protein NEUTE1DRAFT_81510 [Neurospora tetrasperma FGSC 2508]|uniref:Thioredoxin domain-containing protein n=1 Tax=Neurospora tetrasperma (strain FGSC 2508 / ATCC MYA-4615 / P0657) TaxID=510951 RepID=F8MM31_NEUT8|nr:uncharacterized protein NEUTE1DRAFT_81510 [Neurospora tetrasperma FGSC 2508]EGO57705.1 hypothetical protein NEUTE1DRAFT_81510 [Neurospora tetrasperma FGSC 2508]